MSKQRLLRRIRAHFPALEFTSARLNKQGQDHDVVILDDHWVFRFPKWEEGLAHFRFELDFLDQLSRELPLAFPEYKLISEDRTFGAYRMIEGHPLRRSILARLPAAARKNIASQIGVFLSHLHRIPLDEARACGIKEDQNRWGNRGYTEHYYSLMKNMLFPLLEADEVSWLAESVEGYLSQDLDVGLVPAHLDVRDVHLLLAPDRARLSGLIDFTDMEINDPALDFAELWLYGEAFTEEVLSHYSLPTDENFRLRGQLGLRFWHATAMIWALQNGGDQTSAIYQVHYKELKRKKSIIDRELR